MPENPEVRCALCGKLIDEGDNVIDMRVGKLKGSDVTVKRLWGVTHKACFDKHMPSPRAALDAIRRMARAKT